MSLLNGGNAGRQPAKRTGFQGAVAGASRVTSKPSTQRRPIDFSKLRSIQNQKKSGLESYKLNVNGRSRFRLIMPLGDDTVPLTGANRHWIPFVNEEGKEIKRPFYCYEQFGLPCPICTLRNMLLNARDESLKADAETLRASNMWAAYIINRDYLVNADDPIAAQDDRQDKVVLFNSMSPRIADSIIGYLEMKVWGDATDPDNGYDFEVEGKPTGKVYNGYKVSDYTLTPYPRDYSPKYKMELISKLRPLSEAITYSRSDDLRKVFDPILISLSEANEEAAEIVEAFRPEYEHMLLQIDAGPGVQLDEETEEEVYDREQIEVTTGGDDHAESTPNAQPRGKSVPEVSGDTEIGEQADAQSEGGSENSDESEQVPAGDVNPAPWDPNVDLMAPAKEKPVMPPKPAASTIVGKLQAIGKK